MRYGSSRTLTLTPSTLGSAGSTGEGTDDGDSLHLDRVTVILGFKIGIQETDSDQGW